MKDIIIIGTGGFGKEVAWLAEDCGRKVLGFLDDGKAENETAFANYKVLGKTTDWVKFADKAEFVIAIGNPHVKAKVLAKITADKTPIFANLIHPRATVSKYVKMGTGNMICAGVVVTVDVTIGNHVIINLNTSIGHDCVIDDGVTIAPLAQVSGNVNLKKFVEVGTGAGVRQGITIGEGATVGMGSVVVKEVAPNTVVVGNPAKALAPK